MKKGSVDRADQLPDSRQSGSNPANISKRSRLLRWAGQAGLPVLFQFAEPDVAEADWVILVLQG